MEKTNAATLQELVQISRDGKSFYEASALHTRNPVLRGVFARMANAKQELIGALSDTLEEAGEAAPSGGTLCGGMREAYTRAQAAIRDDEDATYIAQLEATEDRLLQAFHEVLDEADSPDVQAIVQDQLPKVEACHDEMRSLKAATQPA